MKKLLLIIPFFIAGCSFFDKEPQFNTEIFCPATGHRILILHSTEAEVKEALTKAMGMQRGKKKINYTALYLAGEKTTSIYGMTAEQIMHNCMLIELPRELPKI